MKLLRLASAYRSAMGAQWLGGEELRALRERKLRRLVRHAYETVPYYRQLMDGAGVTPPDIRGLDDLARIPVTTKDDLRRQDPDALISASAERTRLLTERSSGSSGSPFTVRFDARFAQVRNGLFLRALRTAGYRPGRRVLFVTGRDRASALKRSLGWHHASIEDSPAALFERLRLVRPDLLYGCTTPLRLLAEEVRRCGRKGWPLRAVLSTAETLDTETRGFLEETFRCGVFDLYGLTEMGLVGWECSEHRGYHLSDDAVLVERLVPENGAPARLVMTNLESAALPFLRFDTGDIGHIGEAGDCPCGRTFSMLRRVEGRVADCLRLGDGRSVSPYALTCRLERVPGIRRFQVVQEGYGAFTVRVVVDGTDGDAQRREIRSALRSVLGQGVDVAVRQVPRIDSEPGRKFRVVHSVLGGVR